MLNTCVHVYSYANINVYIFQYYMESDKYISLVIIKYNPIDIIFKYKISNGDIRFCFD